MGYKWSWSFGGEDPTTLRTMGWNTSSTSTSTMGPTQDQQYKPSSGPARHSWHMDQNSWIEYPAVPIAGLTNGICTVACKRKAGAGPYNAAYIITVRDAHSNRNIGVQMSNDALKLYVDNSFKATSTTTYNFLNWKQVSIYWDFSTSTWKGKVFVDGVEAIAEHTDSGNTANQAALWTSSGAAYGDRTWYIGQVILQDSYSDACPPRFVTRVAVDTDIQETGTWTPDSGTANHARIGGDPFNAAHYTQETSPSVNDRVTCGTSANLTNKLGAAPASVDCATVHAFATGVGIQAKAGIGDNQANPSTFIEGAATNTGATTTYLFASSTTKPDNSAYTGNDSVAAAFKVTAV